MQPENGLKPGQLRYANTDMDGLLYYFQVSQCMFEYTLVRRPQQAALGFLNHIL